MRHGAISMDEHHPLLGRFEREATAAYLFAMVQQGQQWPISANDALSFYGKAVARNEAFRQLKQRLYAKYQRRYTAWYVEAHKRWRLLALATLGLAPLFGLIKRPVALKPICGGSSALRQLWRRIDSFVENLARSVCAEAGPVPVPMLLRGFYDLRIGLAELQELGGLRIEESDAGFLVHPEPVLERLFARWEKRQTVH